MDVSKIPHKYHCRNIIKDSLSRISDQLSNVNYIEKIITATKLPYIFSKNNYPLKFDYNNSESMFKETYIKLSWVLKNKDVSSAILLSFNLTENTLDKTILLIFEIE